MAFETPSIVLIRHPEYTANYRDWKKYRDVYTGGQDFIDNYLEKYSVREGDDAFAKRKAMSYNPAFAKEAVDEIKNSIFQRLPDITRDGGSETYTNAMMGQAGGVDLLGSSMDCFIGKKVLPELLPMGRVGIYVDMPYIPSVPTPTLADIQNKRPYIYIYKVEDICSWLYDEDENTNEYRSVFLRNYVYQYDEKTGLPLGYICQYRHFWINNGVVNVQYYDASGKETEIKVLNIPRIPFYVADIGGSLLAEVANYQIALLNMASSDVSFALNANVPMYTEQYEPRAESINFRKPAEDGTEAAAQTTAQDKARTGSTVGRRYPIGTERPGYIHPSSEPLKASMDKQEQMKRDIRELVNLSLANIDPKMASAESKSLDREGLESGLSYIGLELENAERKIAEFWAMYEKSKPATIFYPEVYKIRTQAEKDLEAKNIKDTLPNIPSKTYHKEAAKKIAWLTIGRDIDVKTFDKVENEIDAAKYMTSDPDTIKTDVEIGLVSLSTASEARGYQDGEVEKAKNDHAERLARIAEHQAPKGEPASNAGARGVQDKDASPTTSGSTEKKASLETTKDSVVKDKQRGKGK
jgi:hypothetical protein